MTGRKGRPYSVGYKRPPQETQFKPGQSGNPKGRPKGAKSFAAAFDDELQSRIVGLEGGKRRSMTKREAVAKRLVHKALAGDPRAISLLLNEARNHEGQHNGAGTPAIIEAPEDLAVMESFIRRIRQFDPPGEAVVEKPKTPADPSSSGPTPRARRVRR
jgi:hypothetical protein